DLIKCMEELQDYLVKIDPLKREIRKPEYGKNYVLNLLKEVNKNKGIIYLAFDKNKFVGCVAGNIKNTTKNQELDCIKTRIGRILELVIFPEYRGKGLSNILMKKIEDYLIKEKCNVIKIEVMAYNKIAYNLYKKYNYEDRMIDLIKVLK
ncbi:GNAT family N-acetyltransferase, partial [Candidatus Woesearchaeota archaeon]|nr:GNAT family N-acetyltransferase [Candidatus Woesearchaeota archaeon]